MSADSNLLLPAAYSPLVAVEEYDSEGSTGHDLPRADVIPIPFSVGRAVRLRDASATTLATANPF
jgi:hypothetical protein